MQKFSVGKASVTRIEETYLAVYDPKELFSEFTDEICQEHLHWMAPHHYDPAVGQDLSQRAQLAAADRRARRS